MSKHNTSYEIPFFDHGESLFSTIRNSSKRRNQSVICFIFKKIRNIILYWLSFFCPLNSWRIQMHRWRGVKIGKNVYIAQQVVLDNAYPEFILIGNYVSINQGTTILTHTNIRYHFKGLITPEVKPVVIEDMAFIAINSTILPGVKVGKYAVVSAGSVVEKNVADYTMIQGNPAKKIIMFKHLLASTT